MKRPADIEATFADLLLWQWKCATCQRPRGEHVEQEGALHCLERSGHPSPWVYTPATLHVTWHGEIGGGVTLG